MAADSAGRGISVTLKDKTGAAGTWRVFHGSVAEVVEDIVTFYSIPESTAKDLGPSELVDLVTKMTHGQSVVIQDLGATPISTEVEDKGEFAKAQPPTPAQEAKPEADPTATLIKALENAATLDELKLLWARNKDSFSDKAVQKAYKVRGQALKKAA